MNPLITVRKAAPLVLLAIACLALLPAAQAVNPPPDGGYPGHNTAEGQGALSSLNVSTGTDNTAVGWRSLRNNVQGDFNTAIGSEALTTNTGNMNTAIGSSALFSNTVGGSNTALGMLALFQNTTGSINTAVGDSALVNNTTGSSNTASGYGALQSNTTGDFNTATGVYALRFNTSGVNNTATGLSALETNTTGDSNTANGLYALLSNTTGTSNTATGAFALNSNTIAESNTANGAYALYSNTMGNNNTAIGFNTLQQNINGSNNTANGRSALFSNTAGNNNVAIGVAALLLNTTGSNNIALGLNAGNTVTSGNGNVFIGAAQDGAAADESNHTYIRNINTTVQSFSAGVNNYVTVRMSDGRLGYTAVVSSRRYKEDIRPMHKISQTLYGLKPVTFRLKKAFDPSQALSFGLIAEDVEKVDPNLVYRNEKGEVESVRYDMVNAMLLNEFLKEHRHIQEQDAIIARQQQQIEALAAGLQKVTAQLEMSKPEAQTVLNNQ